MRLITLILGLMKLGISLKHIIILVLGLFLLANIFNMNFIVRKFGGETTINLDTNQKLVNLTWKDSSFWILTEEMNKEDIPKVYKFKENSNFGIFEGSVILIESKDI